MNDRLKLIRESLKTDKGKKYTQTEFASEMLVTRDMIATYESGRVVPSDLYIEMLCKKFGVNEIWLRTGEGDMFSPISKTEQLALLTKKLMKDEDPAYREELVKIISEMDLDTLKIWYEYAKQWVSNVENRK